MLKIRCIKNEKPIRKPFKANNDVVRLDKRNNEWVTNMPPEVGMQIIVPGSGHSQTPADGVYLLDNGKVLTCKSGVIIQITNKRNNKLNK